MSSNALLRCTPEEIGLSSRQVESCIRALSHDLTTMNGFMAARHGKVFAECWWSPYRAELVHLQSLSRKELYGNRNQPHDTRGQALSR